MTEKNPLKDDNLKTALTSIEKAYGKGAVQCLGERPRNDGVAVIRSGSLALDDACRACRSWERDTSSPTGCFWRGWQ